MKYPTRTFLFLYSEVMPYTLACLRTLHDLHDVDIHVVRWDIKKLTPYRIQSQKGITFYERSSADVLFMKKLLDDLKPRLVYVVGRMDRDYLKVAVYARRKKIITISGWDNQWNGSLRNYLAIAGARWLYKPYFDFIMVAGILQYDYVRRIGYPKENIIFDQYSCDFELFNNAFKIRQANDFKHEKKIIFVGRLTEVKGVKLLVSVFNEIKKSFPEWKLILIGNGHLKQSIQQDEQIKIFDFSDQVSMASMLTQVSFFCLPSYKEPWGVVIHEMAAAGLPLITSDVCGASTRFLKDG
ncbi:MAG TPA: glycosyltransferase family 4 protein, partial [Saprospiraceae bacterium]|nr:glycosyltransferase family 4 protein [Saprospiraceae bacterium]